MAPTLIGPTDVDFYADHTNEALDSIVDRYLATSLDIALMNGNDHPLVAEALEIAHAALLALTLRKATT